MTHGTTSLRLAMLTLSTLSCVGDVGLPGGPTAAGNPANEGTSSASGAPAGSTSGTATTTSALCATRHTVGAAAFEHLTRDDYVRAVQDLTGVAVSRDDLPPDDATQGFELGVSSSPLLVDAYARGAERVASATDVLALAGCASPTDDGCVEPFLARLARRAFRRTPTPEELASLAGLVSAGRSGGDLREGLRLALEAVLASPSFLYHVDETAAPDATGLAPLTPAALASRLAFLVWGSVPDVALLDAAERGALRDEDDVRREVARMLSEGREGARAGFARFYAQWLGLEPLATLTRDGTRYPAFSPELAADMERSLRRQIDETVWSDASPLTDILRGSDAYVNAALAPVFGVTATGDTLVRAALDPAQRAGILTHPALLSVLAKPNQSAPVLRGKFVREQLLCQKLPPPPPDVVVSPPDPAPGLTTRERFAEHARDPACAGCHALMDPIGFGLEHFDAIGRYRAEDEGAPVDAHGEISGTSDAAGTFTGAVELAALLADSSAVRDCIATQYFRFAVRRTEVADDACSLAAARDSLDAGSGDLPSLIAAVATSDAFRYRKP